MARRVRDSKLDSREARRKLAARGKPYWRLIEQGLHLGYRRLNGRDRSGTWCARHYIGNQQYEVQAIGAADDYSDADGEAVLSFWQAQAKAREQMVARANTAAGKTGPWTVKDAMDHYFRFLKAHRKPERTARSHYRCFIEPRLGAIEVDKLTTEKIKNWFYDISESDPLVRTGEGEKRRTRSRDPNEDEDEWTRRRQASANRTLTTLKAALNLAWNDGKAVSNDAWRKVKPFAGVDAARLRYLSIEESKRLINACAPDFRKLLRGALLTGARYGQLARTVASDFNPDGGTLRLTTRKGDGKLKVFHTKLSTEGRRFFEEATAGLGSGDPIFLRADGTKWDESEQTRPMAAACEAAKIDPPIGIHGLRHTWASHAVMNGVPLLVVAKNLGHSDTRMTERHYGHLAPSYIEEAIEAGAPRFGFEPESNVTRIGARS